MGQKIDLTSSTPSGSTEKAPEVTSLQVKEWATEEQKKDLEDGEIIDDELQIISITNRRNSLETRPTKIDQPLKAFTKNGGKKRGRKAKKSTHKKNAKNNEINRQK